MKKLCKFKSIIFCFFFLKIFEKSAMKLNKRKFLFNKKKKNNYINNLLKKKKIKKKKIN
jgi:hypothetical protein